MESKQRESIKGNPINPTHYDRLSPEPKDVIRSWELNFNLGNAVKYVARAGHPNCKCTMHPIFAEMENGEGVSCGVLEMEVPKGTPPEEIIQMAIKKIYGVE